MSNRAAIEVVAHRGFSSEEPEHSLAAYLRAVEAGADAVECDVRLTADGQLVLVHDRRIDRVSVGRGPVAEHSLAELQQYAFGTGWHDLEEPESDARSRLLTLEVFLSELLALSDTLQFAIETKHPTRFGHYVEDELAAVLTRFGLTTSTGAPRVRMMSFSQLAVRRMPKLIPGIRTVKLVSRAPWRYRSGVLPDGVFALGPGIDLVRKHPDLVRRVKARGGHVHVWTVDERDDVELCVELGVDAIITNRPSSVLEWLDREH